MIVYSGTKKTFNDDVINNVIGDKILDKLKYHGINGGGHAEFRSWENSLNFMRNVLDDDQIPNDANIAIEYMIPKTSKRVDFIISGCDEYNNENLVVVELKQWEKAEKVDDLMLHSVKTFTGNANRIVSHPSYQAYSYASFIKNYSLEVEKEQIKVNPCAYLHNYDPRYLDQINDKIYEQWYKEAPFFIKNQVRDFRNFIKKFISKKSNSGDLLYKIDNGAIRPSKSLQDSLVSLMKGKEEFILIDD